MPSNQSYLQRSCAVCLLTSPDNIASGLKFQRVGKDEQAIIVNSAMFAIGFFGMLGCSIKLASLP